jgi:hypothetical protein
MSLKLLLTYPRSIKWDDKLFELLIVVDGGKDPVFQVRVDGGAIHGEWFATEGYNEIHVKWHYKADENNQHWHVYSAFAYLMTSPLPRLCAWV